MRALVVHYAQNPFTARTARAIAAKLDGDLDVVFDFVEGDGTMGWRRRAAPILLGPLHLSEPAHDLVDYDVVVVGSPVWDGTFTASVDCFLRESASSFSSLALFSTSGGAYGRRALVAMARAASTVPIATLALERKEEQAGLVGERITGFVAAIVGARRESLREMQAADPRDPLYALTGMTAFRKRLRSSG